MTPATARRWITVQEAAEYTHLHVLTVRNMIARGIIPAFRLGRIIRVDLRALEKRDAARIPAANFKRKGGYAEKARPCG
jgi:excisionase family DNA binding protein